MRRTLVTAVALTAVLAVSCSMGEIEGSGDVVTEEREVGDFDRIAISGMGITLIEQGDTEYLTVQADDNMMRYIRTEVRDGVLHIGQTPMAGNATLRPTTPFLFNVGLKELSGIVLSGSASVECGALRTELLDVAISGSGDVGIERLDASRIAVAISGSGEMSVDGRVASQRIAISGSGRYRASDLESSDSEVDVAGSGVVVIWVTDRLGVDITGSGVVSYYGTPEVVESITGSGTMRALGARGASA